MAKKTKLNKRVLLILGILFGMLLIVGAIYGVNHWPKDEDTTRDSAEKAVAAGNFQQAIKDYSTLIRITDKRPEDQARYLYKMGQVLWEYRNDAALSDLEKHEKVQNAVGFLSKALVADKNLVDAQRLICDIYWNYQGGRVWPDDQYIVQANNLILLDPKDPEAYFRRGEKHASLALNQASEHTQPAIEDYQKAISLKKDEPKYWVQMALFMEMVKVPDAVAKAEKVFRDAIVANPRSAKLYNDFANFQRRHDNRAEARELVRTAIKMAPNDIVGYLGLAQERQQENDLPGAIKALEDGRNADPSDTRTYTALCQLYARQGDLPKAAQSIRDGLAALAKKPTSQSSASEAIGRIVERLNLNTLLANALLDQMTKDTPEARKKHRDEVQSLLDECAQFANESSRSPYIPDTVAVCHDEIAGRLALLEGRVKEAIKLFESTYKKSRESKYVIRGAADFTVFTGAVNMLLNAYMIDQRPGEAEKLADQLLDMPGNQNNPRILLFKARLERDNYRNFDKAKSYVQLVLKNEPANTEAVDMLQSLNAITSSDLTNLPKDLHVTRDNISLFMDQVEKAWNSGEQLGAVKLLEELCDKAPEAFRLQLNLQLVNYYTALKQDEKGAKLLQTLIDQAKDEKTKTQLKQVQELMGTKDLQKRYQKMLELADRESDPLRKVMAKASAAASFNITADYAKFIDEAAKIKPDDKVVISRKFDLALEARNWDEAQKWADKGTSLDVDNVKGLMFKARLAIARNNFPEATGLLEQIYAQHPESRQVQNLLADVYRLGNNLAKAEELYDQIAKSDPGYFPALLGMALVTDRPDRALDHKEYVERAYRMNPNHPYVHEQHLAIEEMGSKPEDVIVQRRKMLQQRPDDLNNILHLAVLYERTRQRDRAEEMFTLLFKNSPEKISAARYLADFYLRNRRVGDVHKLLESLLKDDKVDRVGVYLMYGDFLVSQDRDKAKEAYAKAIAADPKDPRAYLSMANFCSGIGDWKGSVANIQKFLDLNPASIGQREEKALVMYLINDSQFDQAKQRIDTMLGRKPNDFDVLALRARLAIVQNQLPQAEDALTSAINLNPKAAEPLQNRAQYYLEQNELNKARTDLESAQKLTANPDVSYLLAMVLVRQFEIDKATMLLNDVLNRNRDYRPALELLVRLYLQQKKYTDLQSLLGGYLSKSPTNPQMLVIQSKIWEGMGDSARRIQSLQDAVRYAPESQEILRLYLLALVEEGQYAQAITKIKEYTDRPGMDWMVPVMARALVGLNKTAEADNLFLESYKKTQSGLFDFTLDQLAKAYPDRKVLLGKLTEWTKLRENDQRALYYLGNFAVDAGQYDLAEQTFNKSMALAKNDAQKLQVVGLLAATYYQRHLQNRSEQDFLAKAEKLFLDVLAKTPKDVKALNNLAYLYVDDRNDPAKALRFAEQAAKIQPDGSVLDTYGWVRAKIADQQGSPEDKKAGYEAAKQVLERSVQLESGTANRYHLGWVYEKLGRSDEALKLYRQVFENVRDKTTDPLYEPIKNAIQRLGR